MELRRLCEEKRKIKRKKDMERLEKPPPLSPPSSLFSVSLR